MGHKLKQIKVTSLEMFWYFYVKSNSIFFYDFLYYGIEWMNFLTEILNMNFFNEISKNEFLNEKWQ